MWEEGAKGKYTVRHSILRKSGSRVRGPGFKPHSSLNLVVTFGLSLPLLKVMAEAADCDRGS